MTISPRLLLASLFLPLAVHAALPARTAWRATASGVENAGLGADMAIDGDEKTRWSSAFGDGQWLQIDFGKPTPLGGARVHWEVAHASIYTISVSDDGTHWTTVYRSADGRGGVEFAFFTQPVAARWLRIEGIKRVGTWGVSLIEFDPIAAEDAPRIAAAKATDSSALAGLWDAAATAPVTLRGPDATLDITFGREQNVAGVEVFWAGARSSAQLERRDAAGRWQVVANDVGSVGGSSFLAMREPATLRELRLRAKGQSGRPVAIERLRLLGPTEKLTLAKRYQIAASRSAPGLFPAWVSREQTYWTVFGVPAGREKSIIDEYGNVEPLKHMPAVQPLLRTSDGRVITARDVQLSHGLAEGWMPLPWVRWNAPNAPTLQIDNLGAEVDGRVVTLTRYRLRNGSDVPMSGRLYLAVRPLQINPIWQYAGPVPITTMTIAGTGARTTLQVNGVPLLQLQERAVTRGVAPLSQGDIARFIAADRLPLTAAGRDVQGEVAGAMGLDYRLAPRETRDVVVAFPLAREAQPALAHDFDFESLHSSTISKWRERMGDVVIRLPDTALADSLRAQVAYMLLNQTGHAMQPGPRNYNRSFLRDGAATAAIMLRMGQRSVARDYLRWYAKHAVHPNGLVSPILQADGSVAQGFGSDIEYDSQGQFIALVADVARMDGGPESVREHWPQVQAAMRFLVELRQRTMVPGYLADRPSPERFRGILAPSISHEGYGTPHHSYWDDYWAIKGWHDGAWLAQAYGDAKTEQWARAEGHALRESMAASVRSTIAWKGIDFIPSSADLGDDDATGVSIAFDPCNAHGVLPERELRRTYELLWEKMERRRTSREPWDYTPYEFRNVLSFAYLGQPDKAHQVLTTLWDERRPKPWFVWPEVVYSDPRRGAYVGDMPHTWVGAELLRSVFGMLFRETDERLELLPSAPAAWTQGSGLALSRVPTAFGALSLRATRSEDQQLIVELDPGLRDATRLKVWWPQRRKPTRVRIDGVEITGATEAFITLDRPFRRLEASW